MNVLIKLDYLSPKLRRGSLSTHQQHTPLRFTLLFILFVISPRESFSPESEGRVKPSTAMEAIRTHGMIRLKK